MTLIVSNLPLDKRQKEVYSMTIHVRIETRWILGTRKESLRLVGADGEGIDYRSGAGGSKSSRVASLPGRQVEL